MNFTTFLSEEKITAADFENFITVAFNGGPEKDKDTPIKSMDAYNAYLPALKKIAKALKGAGFKGRMIQTGKAKENSIQHGWEPTRHQKPIWWSATTASLSKSVAALSWHHQASRNDVHLQRRRGLYGFTGSR